MPKTKQSADVWQFILDSIANIESEVKKIKAIAKKLWTSSVQITDIDPELFAIQASELSVAEEDGLKIVEWIFDGTFMVWADWNKYPVPTNYSSKSKLIQWDWLKCTILKDGTLKYKVINQIERKFLKWTLIKSQNWQVVVVAWDRQFRLNQAAVTYYGGEIWDDATIIVPAQSDSDFWAIELVVKNW